MARVDREFDTVRMMRSIRARISEDMRGMTFEEQRAYIRGGPGSSDHLRA